MSVYVYVTRKDDPLANGGPAITRVEWDRLISEDPDLVPGDPPDKFPSDRTIYAEWRTYSGGYSAWFGFVGGNIEVKGIDDALLAKLRTFATKLRARIVSELGEELT